MSDGGGKVFAARHVLEGVARVTRALWRFVHKELFNPDKLRALARQLPTFASR